MGFMFPPLIPTTTAEKDPRPHHEFYRGDTIQIPFQVVCRKTKAPLNVTGWTFWLTAKFAIPNPDAQAAFSGDNIPSGKGGIAVVSATQGQALATIQPITTYAWGDGPIHVEYDIQACDTYGVITTIEYGEVTIVPDVTKAIAVPVLPPSPPKAGRPFLALLTGPGASTLFTFPLQDGVSIGKITCTATVVNTSGMSEVVGDTYATTFQAAWSLVGNVAQIVPSATPSTTEFVSPPMVGTSFTPGALGVLATVSVKLPTTLDPTTRVSIDMGVEL